MMLKNLILPVLFFIFLGGCALGPDFERPDISFADKPWVKEKTDHQDIYAFTAIEEKWWESLGDEDLNTLIDHAVSNNLDLKIAQKNLARAHAMITQARSGLFPGVDAQGTVTRSQISENTGTPIGPDNPRIRNTYGTGLVSSWELDIFGGTRREIAAAYARYQNIAGQKRDTLLLVLSEVAGNYIQLRGEQQRARIIKENIALQDKTVRLVKQRFDTGEASEFDYSRALALLQSAKARLPNITGQTDTLIYRISILTGQPPEALLPQLSTEKALPLNPEIVPIGLRSDLLRRRPDVIAAERRLEAEVNDIGARVSDLFPKFTLTGNVGYQSIGADDFISGSSRIWGIGPGLRWPVFNAGRIRAQINAEKAEAEAAAFAYEKTVLLALEDAEAAFIEYGRELETRAQLRQAVETRNKNVHLSQKRYEKGLNSLIDLIDTEREALSSQEDLITSETQSLLKLVRLYKSLGGGWIVLENKKIIGDIQ